jgi:hypothetical protein
MAFFPKKISGLWSIVCGLLLSGCAHLPNIPDLPIGRHPAGLVRTIHHFVPSASSAVRSAKKAKDLPGYYSSKPITRDVSMPQIYDLYLFPDQTYYMTESRPSESINITDSGEWYFTLGWIRLVSEGRFSKHQPDRRYLPVNFKSNGKMITALITEKGLDDFHATARKAYTVVSADDYAFMLEMYSFTRRQPITIKRYADLKLRLLELFQPATSSPTVPEPSANTTNAH